jgi:uncharacterized membrane protein required for colicin V production
VINSGLHRRPPRCTNRLMTIIWIVATCIGVAWAGGMHSLGHVGLYRGMVPFTLSLTSFILCLFVGLTSLLYLCSIVSSLILDMVILVA